MGSVGNRILLLLCAVVVLFAVGIAGWQLHEQRHLALLYKQASSETARTANKLAELRGKTLANIAVDYTYWDEMVAFVRKQDPKWAKNNLETAMSTYQANGISIYSPNGDKVYSVDSFQQPGLRVLDISPDQIKSLFATSPFRHFFMQTKRGLLEVRGATIVPSADSKHTGPARGYFLAFRIWDSGYVKELGSLFAGSARLQPASTGNRLLPGEQRHRTIAFRKPLCGADGRTLQVLCVTKRFAEGDLQRTASRLTITLMVSFAVLMISILLFGLSRFVARPLGLISRAMACQSPEMLSNLRKDPSEFGRLAALIRDFSEQKCALEEETRIRARAEVDIKKSEQNLWTTLHSIGEAVISTDVHGRVVRMNPVAEKLTGWSISDGLARQISEVVQIVDTLTGEPMPVPIDEVLSTGEVRHIADQTSLISRDGTQRHIANSAAPIRDETGGMTGVVLVFSDMTEQYRMRAELLDAKTELEAVNQQLEQALLTANEHAAAAQVAKEQIEEHAIELSHQALHDELTALPNRKYFEQHLAELISRDAGKQARSFVVLFLDLDRFKQINDTLGHKVGDLLLIEVGERLQTCLRSEDVLARMGGDEFTMIISRCNRRSVSEVVASRMIDSISRPFEIQGHKFVIGASIGLANYPSDGKDTVELLKHADAAMYKAKQAGRGTFRWFTGDVDVDNQRRADMEMDIRAALDNGQFNVCYQPIVSLESGEITSAEALLRWKHPDKGFISPSLFIPIAEEVGLIGQIGDYVLRAACAQTMAWRSEGIHLTQIGVNVSTAQVCDPRWLYSIRAALSDAGMEAPYLDLEVTENDFAADYDSMRENLKAAEELGVCMSIDDFGMGQSSLSRLKDFPVVHLKIDGSFVRDIEHSKADNALVRSIIELAHSQGIKVTAEWVETESQMEILRSLGCDYAQGYRISPALSAEAFAEFVCEWKSDQNLADAA